MNCNNSIPVILDTNILLDLIIFKDISVEKLQVLFEKNKIYFLFSCETVNEFKRVINYDKFKFSEIQKKKFIKELNHLIGNTDIFYLNLNELPVIVRDPDDHKFIELAYHTKTKYLLTKDHDLLKIKKKLIDYGIQALKPEKFYKKIT